MLYEIMSHIRNFFPEKGEARRFVIEDGMIDLPFVKNGQFFLIEGSSLNDGVYKYPANELDDEEFDGIVTSLKPPKDFLSMVEEIEAWQNKYGDINSASMSPFQSESFGGYSYSKGSSGSNSGGSSTGGWKDVFRSRLNTWRKM